MKIKNKLKSSLKGLFGALVLSGLFLVSPMASFAGSPVETPAEEGWTLIAEKGDVKAYAQIVTCGADAQSMYLIKLVNNNKSENLLVEYSINVTNSTTAGTSTVTTEISSNSSVEGSCDNKLPELMAYMENQEDGYNPLEIIIRTTKNSDHEK